MRESNCRAVSILMGCSRFTDGKYSNIRKSFSVKIVEEGDGFDGRSMVYEYAIAQCPCVVGMLFPIIIVQLWGTVDCRQNVNFHS